MGNQNSKAQLNQALIKARHDNEFTQEQVAVRLREILADSYSKAPVDKNMVSKWERNRVKPGPVYREALCTLYGKSEEELQISPKPRNRKQEEPYTSPIILSSPLPALIGRDEDIARICEQLQKPEVRLLTLTGAPGMGKTSLAMQVAYAPHMKHIFTNGVLPILLDAIREKDKDLIVGTIAHTLGLKDTGQQPLLERLIAYLKDKHLLLVLDNCEHLIEACVQLVEILLCNCSKLKILATSTELLGIDEEDRHYVSPLKYPDPSKLPPTEELRQYSAVKLFEMRRQKVDPGYIVTDKDVHSVAEICACLDGIPLFIRLAAGVHILSISEIAEQLDGILPVLVGSNRSNIERHQTAQKALEWRYSLLQESEKTLLQRLSVFRGGFTSEAAESVCAYGELEVNGILQLLEKLTDKSLVEVQQYEERTRFRMLEVIRQFAYKKLEDAGQADELKREHRYFFLEMYAESESEPQWLETERENLRAVLQFSLEEQDSEGSSLVIVVILTHALFFNGYWNEARYWMMSIGERV